MELIQKYSYKGSLFFHFNTRQLAILISCEFIFLYLGNHTIKHFHISYSPNDFLNAINFCRVDKNSCGGELH